MNATYHCDQIEVVAHMPSLVTGDEPNHDRDDEDKGEEGDDSNEDQGEKPPSRESLTHSLSPRVMAPSLNSPALPILMRSSSTPCP